MLINFFMKKRQLKVAELTAQGQQQQQLLAEKQGLLKQRAKAFISSTPGLIFSFAVGCVFQLRHQQPIKLLRKVIRSGWLNILRA